MCDIAFSLANIVVGPVPRKFSLQMDEYQYPEAYLTEDGEPMPAPKRKRLSLSKKKAEDKMNKAPSSSHFDTSIASASHSKQGP